MNPATDIEKDNNNQTGNTFEDSWQITSDEPVRRIIWCSLKVVEETAQEMHVCLGGIFERIHPLEYHGE